jgi:hypothetical protein
VEERRPCFVHQAERRRKGKKGKRSLNSKIATPTHLNRMLCGSQSLLEFCAVPEILALFYSAAQRQCMVHLTHALMQALNKILDHMGFPEARRFTERLIGKVRGFTGKYTGAFTIANGWWKYAHPVRVAHLQIGSRRIYSVPLECTSSHS